MIILYFIHMAVVCVSMYYLTNILLSHYVTHGRFIIKAHRWLFPRKCLVLSALPILGRLRRQVINLELQISYCQGIRPFGARQTAQYHLPKVSLNEGMGGLCVCTRSLFLYSVCVYIVRDSEKKRYICNYSFKQRYTFACHWHNG